MRKLYRSSWSLTSIISSIAFFCRFLQLLSIDLPYFVLHLFLSSLSRSINSLAFSHSLHYESRDSLVMHSYYMHHPHQTLRFYYSHNPDSLKNSHISLFVLFFATYLCLKILLSHISNLCVSYFLMIHISYPNIIGLITVLYIILLYSITLLFCILFFIYWISIY